MTLSRWTPIANKRVHRAQMCAASARPRGHADPVAHPVSPRGTAARRCCCCCAGLAISRVTARDRERGRRHTAVNGPFIAARAEASTVCGSVVRQRHKSAARSPGGLTRFQDFHLFAMATEAEQNSEAVPPPAAPVSHRRNSQQRRGSNRERRSSVSAEGGWDPAAQDESIATKFTLVDV